MGVVVVCLEGGGEYYLCVSVCVECFFELLMAVLRCL